MELTIPTDYSMVVLILVECLHCKFIWKRHAVSPEIIGNFADSSKWLQGSNFSSNPIYIRCFIVWRRENALDKCQSCLVRTNATYSRKSCYQRGIRSFSCNGTILMIQLRIHCNNPTGKTTKFCVLSKKAYALVTEISHECAWRSLVRVHAL